MDDLGYSDGKNCDTCEPYTSYNLIFFILAHSRPGSIGFQTKWRPDSDKQKIMVPLFRTCFVWSGVFHTNLFVFNSWYIQKMGRKATLLSWNEFIIFIYWSWNFQEYISFWLETSNFYSWYILVYEFVGHLSMGSHFYFLI